MASYRKIRDRQPRLTHHRARVKGVVRIDGEDVYCGPYGTPECQARYLRAPAERAEAYLQEPVPEALPETTGPADVSINELLVGHLAFANLLSPSSRSPTSSWTPSCPTSPGKSPR